MRKKNVIVTGATSFLGAAVVEELAKNGYQTYSIVRPDSVNLSKIVKHMNNHVIYENLNTLENICASVKSADVFIHFGWDGIGSAGRSDPAIQKRNIDNAVKALNIAHTLGCKTFIFSGSQAEYGIQRKLIKENNNCVPVSEYGKAKLEFGKKAETLCEEYAMTFIHLRIFSVYGPGDHPWALVPSCIRSFEAGECMKLGECTQLWNYLYISDFASVFTKLIEAELFENTYILNVASDDTRPLREFVEEIYSRTIKKGSYVYGVRPQNAEGPAPLWPDISRIKSLLRWEPKVKFYEGIDRIIHG